jgi:pyruvate dehydrogenase E1 component alpha subunit
MAKRKPDQQGAEPAEAAHGAVAVEDAPAAAAASDAATDAALDAPADPPAAAAPNDDDAADPALNRALLRSMLLQRRFEERTAEAYAIGKIGGFCHLYIGQEAVSTGSMSLLREDDYVITTYRDHGQALARGIPSRAVMAELFGRADGVSGGKGGSMHIFDARTNFLGGHGIVGGHVPLGTGVAFAIKYRGGDQVCVCFMGESVVNTGAFHEALNMAGLWKLPVRVRHREQPLRHGHGARARLGHPRHLRARRGVQHARGPVRRAGRVRGAPRHRRGGRRARAEQCPRCSRSARTASWATR